MAGRELVLKRANRNFNLKEESMKVKLRDVWNKGHPYVEIREEGKGFVFFCTLCLTKCFSDTVLDDHLQGNRHSKRRAFSDSTLFNDIPWPFNDGVLFCFNQPGRDKQLSHPRNFYENKMTSEFNTNFNDGCLVKVANAHGRSSKSACFDDDCADNLGIVESLNDCVPLRSNDNLSLATNGNGETLIDVTDENYRIIHGALIKERQSVLGIRLMGYGHISARLFKIDELGSKTGRIWCAWLGEGNSDDKADLLRTRVSDFAIVTFSYTYDLGRKANIDDTSMLISSESYVDIEDASSPQKLDLNSAGVGRQRKKRKKVVAECTGSFSGDSSCENSSEADDIRQELMHARAAFEYEKKGNAELTEQKLTMQKNLVSMAREVERLRVELANREGRTWNAGAPYGMKLSSEEKYPPSLASYPDGPGTLSGSGDKSFYGVGQGSWGAYDKSRNVPR